MNSQKPCAVVIVTHNSKSYLDRCMNCIKQQSHRPSQIVIVDSGSTDTAYLKRYQNKRGVTVVLCPENIGFSSGNNVGYSHVLPACEHVLFLNPDAFLTPNFLRDASHYLSQRSHKDVGALTGMLLGYNQAADSPTGKYDSTGIFRTWYGRWYDRGQNESFPQVLYQKEETLPAICGALMFCRKKAIDEVLINGKDVFDPAFFMYKEDIDLSMRLRQKGWILKYVPTLSVYHCRGWNPNRKQVPKKQRLMSARNEMRLHARAVSPYVVYSALKYAAVKLFNY